MTTKEIYIALLDEGVNVWRPAPAVPLQPTSDTAFVVLRPDDYDPDLETWEFPPGTIVRCELKRIRDGEILAAVERLALNDRQIA